MSMEIILPRIASHIEAVFGIKPQSVSNHTWVKAVSQRMEQVEYAEVGTYLNHLINSVTEGQQLVESIIVPETWFFRDRIALDFLITHIRSQEALGRRKPWRILSLGCSSGEEAYSIGMALLDAGLSASRFSIEGIDLSAKAIQKAQLAVYADSSFRTKTTLLHQKHFHELGGGRFSVDYNVRSRLSFQQGNILSPQFVVGRPHCDVIFCRNVLIYFKPKSQSRALKMFGDLLEKDGILVVGPMETEIARHAGFELIGMRLSCALRRKDIEPSLAKKPIPIIQKPQDISIPFETDFSRALRLADEGEIEASLSLCQHHLEANGPAPDVLYLMGTLSLASRQLEQAEEYFSRTIYLSPQHYEGLIHLALLAERRGDKKSAALFWTRAKKHDPESYQRIGT